MYFVYIVRCRDGSLYTGTAADLRRRMHAHIQQTAACARYTRSHPVAALEAAWRTQTRPEALRLEALIRKSFASLPRRRRPPPCSEKSSGAHSMRRSHRRNCICKSAAALRLFGYLRRRASGYNFSTERVVFMTMHRVWRVHAS